MRVTGASIAELIYLRRDAAALPPQDRVAKQAVRQIERYLADPSRGFDLPLAEKGTAFQRRVWRAICEVPCGEVVSYGDLARDLRTAPRAVGQACGANWFPLVIPCHRIVASAGLGGFAGSAAGDGEAEFHLGIKRWLLEHERAAFELRAS